MIQVLEAGADFGRVQLARDGGVWKGAGIAELTTPDRRLGEIDGAGAILCPGHIAPIATVPAGLSSASVSVRWKQRGVQQFVETFRV